MITKIEIPERLKEKGFEYASKNSHAHSKCPALSSHCDGRVALFDTAQDDFIVLPNTGALFRMVILCCWELTRRFFK
jgi:hypothetical protein